MTSERKMSGAVFIGCVAGAIGQPADAIGMIERDRQRDRPAERMADDQRLVELHDPDGAGQDGGLFENPPRRRRRIARSRPVEGDDAEIGLEPLDQRMGEIAELAAEPLDQDDRGSPASVEHMQPRAVEIKKGALRRRGPLDPPHGENGEDGQDDLEPDHDEHGVDEPDHPRSHVPLVPPGRTRPIASEATSSGGVGGLQALLGSP